MHYIPPDNFNVINKILKTYCILKLNRGVEVGVRHGLFSEYLLHNNPSLDMILVDPYLPYQDVKDFYTEDMQTECKRDAWVRLERFNHRAKWCYKLSVDAAALFDNEFFDFVFIDGGHDYKNVKQDLISWWKKVRIGGLLSGHDFSMDTVGAAVKDFIFENKIKEIFLSPPDQADCFWIVRT